MHSSDLKIPIELQSFQHLVAKDLLKMNDIIHEIMVDKEPTILHVSDYIIASGGKKLRPMLTIICSKLFGDINNERSINLAAAVELIHTATLLHDDVVDESNLRRGIKTANNKWDNKTTILVGDFLFSQAFRLMVKDGSIKILDILSMTAAIIAEGEVMQLTSSRNLQVTLECYLKIISAKCAELFAASCQVGGIIADCPIHLEINLRNFGYYLGLAFQIIDDILDYSAKQAELGKAIGDDFKEGKCTLPIILSYQKSSKLQRQFLEKTICRLEQAPGDLQKTIDLLTETGALEESIQVARKYIALAKKQLQDIPSCLSKDALKAILNFSLERTY